MTSVLTASTWGPLAHPARTQPVTVPQPWRDTTSFAFWDQARRICGAFSASTSPNGGGCRAHFRVAADATAELSEPLAPGTLTGSTIRFDLDGSLTAHGAGLAAELEVVPRHVHADYMAEWIIPPLVPGEPLHHLQQGAAVSGWVKVRGRLTPVSGLGVRDRRWGYCIECGQVPEYVAVVAGFDSFTLVARKFCGPDGRGRTEGFLLGERGATPVTSMTVSGDRCGRFASARCFLVDGADLVVAVSARLGGFRVPLGQPCSGSTASAYEDFLVLRTRGGDSGGGVVTHVIPPPPP